jgi:hypothetical protein
MVYIQIRSELQCIRLEERKSAEVYERLMAARDRLQALARKKEVFVL